MERILVTVKEASEMLALSPTKVYDLAAKGELDAVYVGRAVRLPYAGLIKFIEDHRN